MSLIVVVGAQYGAEGKGKIGAWISRKLRPELIFRCSGPNSSHTVWQNRERYQFRLLPAGIIFCNATVVFGPGSLLHPKILLSEIQKYGKNRTILIDKQAGIVEDKHIQRQRADLRYEVIGSTLSGTGPASADRCLRSLRLARDDHSLNQFVCDVFEETWPILQNPSKTSVLEGSQGFGLSNYVGTYPYCTSRDCTTAAMLSQAGLPFSVVSSVVLVVKACPTRNTMRTIEKDGNAQDAWQIGIKGLVAGEVKNVQRERKDLDFSLIRRAAAINSATELALTCADVYCPESSGVTVWRELPMQLLKLIDKLELTSGLKVRIVSTGPDIDDMVERT